MKPFIYILVIINMALAMAVVRQQHEMRQVTQENTKQKKYEAQIKQEYEQWMADKHFYQSSHSVDDYAQKQLGMLVPKKELSLLVSNGPKEPIHEKKTKQ